MLDELTAERAEWVRQYGKSHVDDKEPPNLRQPHGKTRLQLAYVESA